MSYAYDHNTVKERIREATDIVELVEHYIPLRRQGRNYVGRCPWHDDTRPSLQVNAERQTFKCWVCDIGGDVFAFVMKIENVDFREALQILADRTGIALPKYQKENTPTDSTGQEITKKQLFQAADWVAKIYHTELLQSEEAEFVREYLEQRKVSLEAIRKFKIGYAPMDGKWLADKTKNSPALLKAMETIGCFGQPKAATDDLMSPPRSSHYDVFRGRLMFPIRDEQGRTVAFGGRVLPDSPLNEYPWYKERKYINTRDTPLFHKSKILYGLDTARPQIKKLRRTLIMEGYTDCITAHEFGFGEAVAVMGTALSPEQIRLLTRMEAEKIILMLDGNKAAQGKAEDDRMLIDFIAQGADVAVLILPEGLDPCDFLEQRGADELNALLQTATVDALEHVFRMKTRNIDVKNDIIASSKALDSILGIIAHAPIKGRSPDDPIRLRLEKMVQSLSVQFRMREDIVRRRLNEKRARTDSRRQTATREPATMSPEDNREPETALPERWSKEELPDLLERDMLELWMLDPTAVYEFWDRILPEHLQSPVTRAIYNQCSELVDHQGKPATFDNLMTAFDDPQMKNYLIDLESSGHRKYFPKDDDNIDPAFRKELPERWKEPEFKELKAKVVSEIIAKFEQQTAEQERQDKLSLLRSGELSEDEETQQLLALQQKLREKDAEPDA